MTDKRNDPFRAFNFSLEIDDIPRGAFSEVSGVVADGDATDYREGTDKQLNTRKLPGLRKYGPIKLVGGIIKDDSLWKWYTNIVNGQPDRRNVTIVLLDEARTPVIRWHAENCWVNKIEGPTFKASGNEVALESVEIVHEGLVMELA